MKGTSKERAMMRQLLERLEAQTKTGVTLRVLSGGKDPAGTGQVVATPPPTKASPAQGMAAVVQGAQQQALPKAPDARFYVDAAAGIPVGETVERNGMRLQRFRPSLRVTDLANAGKRGKGCPQFALYNLDYPFQAAKAAAAVSAALKAIAKAPTYAKAVAIAREAAAPKGQGGAGFQEEVLRGVDVEPAAGGRGARFAIETPTFSLVASLTDFSVAEKRRPGPGGDDTRILGAPYGGAKKAAIKAFYAWVQVHEAEIKGMTFRELSRALADAGLAYHGFSTMD
jgi:hypothetical protein